MIKIKISVYTDEDEANVKRQKDILKGYNEGSVEEVGQVRWDGRDFGGHIEYAREDDEKVWIVTSKKTDN